MLKVQTLPTLSPPRQQRQLLYKLDVIVGLSISESYSNSWMQIQKSVCGEEFQTFPQVLNFNYTDVFKVPLGN